MVCCNGICNGCTSCQHESSFVALQTDYNVYKSCDCLVKYPVVHMRVCVCDTKMLVNISIIFISTQ